MGQYYRNTFLYEDWKDRNDIVDAALSPYSFGDGAKLTEFSYVGKWLMKPVEWLLSEWFKGNPFVCVGDYADIKYTNAFPWIDGDDSGVNVYRKAIECINNIEAYDTMLRSIPRYDDIPYYKYAVNYTKREYTIIPKYDKKHRIMHPIAMLCADGNGKGGGDYFGEKGLRYVGRWAYDCIGVTNDKGEIEGFKRIAPRFEND